jgi:hypothetical protein
MADTWGGVALPVAIPTGTDLLGDHALRIVGDYLSAFLNAYGTTAWSAFMRGKPACGAVYFHDPHRFGVVDTYLPAIFLYRQQDAGTGQAIDYEAIDYLYAGSRWVCSYLYPPMAQELQDKRGNFDNAVVKMVSRAVEAFLDPCYATPGDADPLAASLPAAPTAIKLQVATSAGQQVYTGAALDGATGGNAITPRRPVTVTLGGDPAAFTNGSTIIVEGLDVVGQPLTNTLTIDTSAIPCTLTCGNDFSKVTSITVAAQASGAGTIEFGLGARAGRGSEYLKQAGLEELEVRGWRSTMVDLVMSPDPKRSYYAVEMTLHAKELYQADPTVRTYPNTGTTQTFIRGDGSVIESADY